MTAHGPKARAGAALALAAIAAVAAVASGCERDCTPPCRSGFVCVKGECRSACNPPCPADKLCRAGECFADDTMPAPSVVVHVPLTTDSGTPPAPAPVPRLALAAPEFGCMGEDADGYRKCAPKMGESIAARFAEKALGPIDECLVELEKRLPAAAGKIVLRGDLDLTGGGPVEGLTVTEDGIGDDTFKKCVIKAARKQLYGSECCDYYLRLTLPLYVKSAPPAPADPATASPGSAPTTAGTGSPGESAGSATTPALPGSAAVRPPER